MKGRATDPADVTGRVIISHVDRDDIIIEEPLFTDGAGRVLLLMELQIKVIHKLVLTERAIGVSLLLMTLTIRVIAETLRAKRAARMKRVEMVGECLWGV